MFYNKQYFWTEQFLEFTTKKRRHCFLRQVGFSLWHFSFIPMGFVNVDWVLHNWLKFNDVKAVMWLVIKGHMIQFSRYAFSNSK